MFSENLRNFRRQKGLTQEELAERLYVVRQTVSKWEKGLSVPDSELLIRVAEVFETSVGTLLGDTVDLPTDKNIVAEKLEQLNMLLAERNRRASRIWKAVAIVLISIVSIIVLCIFLFSAVRFHISHNSREMPWISLDENVRIEEPIKSRDDSKTGDY